MNITPVSKQLQAALGATHELRIAASDLTETAANTAQTFTIPVAAGDLFAVIGTCLATAFEDASDGAFNTNTLIIGDGADTDRFLVSQQLNANGTTVAYKQGASAGFAYTAAITVDVTIGSMTGKSLADIDTGELIAYFKLVSLVHTAAV